MARLVGSVIIMVCTAFLYGFIELDRVFVSVLLMTGIAVGGFIMGANTND